MTMRHLGSFGGWFSIVLLAICSRNHRIDALTAPSQHQNAGAAGVVTRDEEILLPNGVRAQVVSSIPSSQSPGKPPMLFLHGSFHGAWCWQEHYLSYFAERGHSCVAFSWRGTGGTPAGEGVKKVKIVEDHCNDLRALLEVLPSILGKGNGDDHHNGTNNDDRSRPIVVSHSMGGIIVMKYLDEIFRQNPKTKPDEVFSGIVSMCSVPPSGNSKTTIRYLRRSLLDTYRITVGFVFKKVITDDTICRECFFGGEKRVSEDGSIVDDFGVSDDDLARYQGYFERDSGATLDVSDLAKRAPSKTTDEKGRAPFLADLPPCLVIGATDDFIVDDVANSETAMYYGTGNPVYIDSPHDVMVGRKWENGAVALHEWIEKTIAARTSN